MSLSELSIGTVFLLFSILSGSAATGVLLHGMLRSKSRDTVQSDSTSISELYIEPVSKQGRPSALDRITLLNRNLIQCPTCSTIDFAHIRFCSRCGTQLNRYSELPRTNTPDVQVRYITRDGTTRMVGLSMGIDQKTRLGVIIGIQNRESPEQINETEERT